MTREFILIYAIMVTMTIILSVTLTILLEHIFSSKKKNRYDDDELTSVLTELKGIGHFNDVSIVSEGYVEDKVLSQQSAVDNIVNNYNPKQPFTILVWSDVLFSTNPDGTIKLGDGENEQMITLLNACSKLNIGIVYVECNVDHYLFIKYLYKNRLRADDILKDTDSIVIRTMYNYPIIFMPNSGMSSAYEILVNTILKLKEKYE